jgi:hypothetical protein
VKISETERSDERETESECARVNEREERAREIKSDRERREQEKFREERD